MKRNIRKNNIIKKNNSTISNRKIQGKKDNQI